jgi:uncharacterized protein (TIGR02421 family)
MTTDDKKSTEDSVNNFSDLKVFLDCDKDLVTIAEEFKILSLIEWPKNTQDQFIADYRLGKAKIPKIDYPKHDYSEALKKLENIIKLTNDSHPVAQYIQKTAKSYFSGHKFVESLGQPDMLKYSLEMYGRPGDPIAGSKFTSHDAADFFIEITNQFNDYFSLENDDICILAETIKAQLEAEIKSVITQDEVKVYIDETLVPKAAAGVSRVRLRSGTCFSRYDFKQLLEHEVFVHTLTALNGKHQPHLKSMGLGSPRTTATQEGLATFAELITGAIDLNRLKRIALRVIAVDMALAGANFIEIFEYFIKNGQSHPESFSSTQRIFRGGDPNGKYVFTKDSVYLDGLLNAHSFFRWAMKNHKLDLTHVLFAGRMTFDDAETLSPFMATGLIKKAKYLPPWLSEVPTLGGYLAFSLFANKINVGRLDKEFAKGTY